MEGDPLKKRDMGIAGALIVLTQVLTNFHSSETVTDRIEELQKEFRQSLVDREQYFVRKIEIRDLSSKIEKVNGELIQIKNQVTSLKALLKDDYPADSEITCLLYLPDEARYEL